MSWVTIQYVHGRNTLTHTNKIAPTLRRRGLYCIIFQYCTNYITPFGADKTMTAVLSGDAEIGFMGSESSIYTYNEGAKDYVVNFAQLTQRAGNFLVAREEMPDFKWEDLKGKEVIGGRKGGVHTSM